MFTFNVYIKRWFTYNVLPTTFFYKITACYQLITSLLNQVTPVKYVLSSGGIKTVGDTVLCTFVLMHYEVYSTAPLYLYCTT
jgi:hypothetical protein